MNSFLSTSVNRKVALFYLGSLDVNNHLKPVLFEIEADPRLQGTKPLANITSFSSFPQEQEVLMMLGSVFRLNEIYLDDEQIWLVKMTLCSDHDSDLRSVFDHMRDQYGSGQTPLLRFGHTLVDMARFDDAENYYRRLLKELPEGHQDLSTCYQALGKVACEKGDYEASLEWLYKSLEIVENNFSKDHSISAFIHTSIGEVYQRTKKNDQALESYQKALTIWNNVLPVNYEYLAWCFNNIAVIFVAQKKYDKALEYHLKALDLKKNNLPKKHPCMGNTYLNIGTVYYYLRRYDQALENYNCSRDIYETSLTPEHPSVANVIKNIGIIHEVQGNYDEALKNYQKASTIRQRTFSSSHPDSKQIEDDIRRVLPKTASLVNIE